MSFYSKLTPSLFRTNNSSFERASEEVSRVTDIFNGFDQNGFTVSGGSVVPDETGTLRITTAGSLACEGGYFATTLEDGAILGPELVVNGGFDTDLTGWSGTSTWNAGVAHVPGLGTLEQIAGPATYGRVYQASFSISNLVGGIQFRVRKPSGGYVIQSSFGSNGNYSVLFTSAGSSNILFIPILAERSGDVDNVSVKEIIPVWKERTGTIKKSVRTLTGSKIVYQDTDPLAWRRATVNPTRTNKCTCRKINPVDTTNISVSGGVTVSVVNDPAKLLAAGLEKICTSGNLYKAIWTSLGTLAISGVVENLNPHSSSIYAMVSGVTGSPIQFGLGGSTRPPVTETSLTKICQSNITPSTTDKFALLYKLDGTGECYFILPQLEEGAFCTDPIIDPADPLAAITRTGTNITKPIAGLFPMVSATEAQNFGIYMRVIPKATGQGEMYLMELRLDTNNRIWLSITTGSINIFKRLGGSTAHASVFQSITANNPIDLIGLYTDSGLSIKVRELVAGSWSTWSAWSDDLNITPAKIGTLCVGGQVYGTNHCFANYPLFAILKLGNQATLEAYQAVAEQEVLKINA